MTTKLNTVASTLKSKYIRQTSPDAFIDTRKKRGLQAEINKLEGIRKTIHTNLIDDKELLRFRAELSKLMDLVTSRVTIIG